MSLPQLPQEIISMILYKYKGIQTPTAKIIKDIRIPSKLEFDSYVDGKMVIKEKFGNQFVGLGLKTDWRGAEVFRRHYKDMKIRGLYTIISNERRKYCYIPTFKMNVRSGIPIKRGSISCEDIKKILDKNEILYRHTDDKKELMSSMMSF